MSIRNRQLSNALNTSLLTELHNGRYPTADIINSNVDNKFQNQTLGQPIFEPKLTSKLTVSDSAEFNSMLDDIFEDLTTCYQEIQYQINRVMANTNLYETQKNKLEQETRELEYKLKGLENKLKTKDNSIFNTFANFQSVDFTGDTERNIPSTTALVDLRFNAVTLNPVGNSIKQDISKAYVDVKILTPYTSNKTLSLASNILKDTINESWRQLITTDQANGLVSVNLDIELEQIIKITKLSLVANSVKDTIVSFMFSKDNQQWQSLSEQSVRYVADWTFKTIEVKFIKITLSKLEPDIIKGTKYQHYFGIQNLTLVRETYQNQAVFTSKIHPVLVPVNNVTLQTNKWLPANTNIDYYIALDNGITPLAWQKILNQTTLNLVPSENKEKLINLYSSANYGRIYPHQSSVKYYHLNDITPEIDLSNIQLYVGVNMWQQEIAVYSDIEQTIDTNPITWVNISDIGVNYLDIKTKSLPVKKDKLTRFTTYIYCEKNSILPISWEAVNCTYDIYTNGNKLNLINGTRLMGFNIGWNKIELYSFTASLGAYVTPDINLEMIGERVIAQKKAMQQISNHEFLNNTSGYNYNVFTVIDNKIIINYDPANGAKSQIEGITYLLTYTSRPQNTINETKGIRLMAVLSREEKVKELSPQLKEYRLIIN